MSDKLANFADCNSYAILILLYVLQEASIPVTADVLSHLKDENYPQYSISC